MRHALLALCIAIAIPAAAETRVPQSEGEIALSFAPVVRSAAPAVVNIYATRVVPEQISPFADDPFFSQFFGDQVVPRVQNSLGSGVILRPNGIVVSNHHVVGGAEDIRVVLSDRREFAGRVLLSDEGADLAVIRLEGAEGLPALELADSDAAEVGDLVLAIGNPFGVGQTVTGGIVSATARSGLGGREGVFIQTDAAINPGNSGGALVDMEGRVLGINTSILTRSGGSQGVGFAIPANLVAQYVAQAEAGRETLLRPWAGIEVQPVDAAMAEAMGVPAPRGVVILDMHPESPFAAAGLEAGDIVTALGGDPVDSGHELTYRLTALGPAGETPVAYWRDGEAAEAMLALAPAPGTDVAPVAMPENTLLAGLTVADLTPALIESLAMPLAASGVVVTDVAGPARATQLQPGDIVTRVNGFEIAKTGDLARAASEGGRNWQIEFVRGGQRAAIRLRM